MRTNKRVGAIIVRDNRLLLIHRRKKGDEYWVLVGGGVEDEESLEEALTREVWEETSLKLIGSSFLMFWNDGQTEHHLFRCEVTSEEPVLAGPEQESNCEDNWYNLEWVDLETMGRIESVYPLIVKDLVPRLIIETN